MRTANTKTILLIICLLSVTFACGCTNWKKKYNHLNVAYQNCEGLLVSEQDQRGNLEQIRMQDQQTIAELQKEIAERGRVPYLEDYDPTFDPAAGTLTLTLPNTILFSAGKATLMKATNKDLDHICSVLQSRHAGRQIDVVGHTDSDPIKVTKKMWKDNWELSAQRALAVVRYLIKRGIPDDKIREVGCGAARPVASNATTSGKAKNRRVEIVVYMR